MRDRRRFGPGPYLAGLRKDPRYWGEGFPYDVPAVDHIEALDLDTPIILLAGDNGTGKSTLIEALAESMGFAPEGGELQRSGELPARPHAVLGGALEALNSGYHLAFLIGAVFAAGAAVVGAVFLRPSAQPEPHGAAAPAEA